jgi:hypothetical protein
MPLAAWREAPAKPQAAGGEEVPTMRCPACRADNAAGPQCRRCRADLSLLFALEDQRGLMLRQAALAARRGDWPEASRLAAEADALRQGEESGRLLAVAALMRGDFSAAWRYYQDGTARANRSPPS